MLVCPCSVSVRDLWEKQELGKVSPTLSSAREKTLGSGRELSVGPQGPVPAAPTAVLPGPRHDDGDAHRRPPYPELHLGQPAEQAVI